MSSRHFAEKNLILCEFLRVRSKKVFVFISVTTIPFFTTNFCSRIWSIGILNRKDSTVTQILTTRTHENSTSY